MISEKWILLAFVLEFIGGFAYLASTIKGVTKPNQVTWLLWGIIPLLAFFLQISEGVGWQAFMTLAIAMNPLLIFLVSFLHKQSSWQLKRLDYICGGLALLVIFLWQITNATILALILTITADALAGIPTIVKAFKSPETENYHVFLFGAGCSIITLLTIDVWDFPHAGFAIYILALCVLLVLVIRFKLGRRVGGNRDAKYTAAA